MEYQDDLIILGIGYNSTAEAAIIRNGRVICAVAEERFNRKKMWYGIPRLSIDWVLKETGISIKDVDYIATHDGIHSIDDHRPDFEKMASRIRESRIISEKRKHRQLRILDDKLKHVADVLGCRHVEYVREIKTYGRPVKQVEHHLAHAASAYFTSGWDSCYALTIDGWGGDASGGLFRCGNGQLTQITRSSIIDSLGYFYGSITKYLGFTPHKHEGKVLGLAGHGNPTSLLPFMREMIGFDDETHSLRGYMEHGFYVPRFDNPWLDDVLNGHKREDIAAAAQLALEEAVLKYIEAMIPEGSKLVLSGGLFANVLLNQKILAMPNITGVYVYPNMGDGGLAVGAALYTYSRLRPLKPWVIDNVYWGPGYRDDEIETVLNDMDVKYQRIVNIEKKIAELLFAGNVVARFNGKMENGPRALGNRSILFRADDPSVNDWLNKRLGRTEFMPFAPVTISEYSAKCYELSKNVVCPAQFMTITCGCTEYTKHESPGIVHIDGTARPQIISKSQNPSYYDIIRYYNELTGSPTIINTSFNMHEEPIVCSPSDAVRAFISAELPYLAIGPFLVTR